uniref:G-protein coupled receptors family 1 profile domain-containing protein n=1 Tax=Leptobrachium leishanense TaxID=445787 RepID=A0A8C5P945_9ANUR
MEESNHSTVDEFYLLGVTNDGIVVLILEMSDLHSPMYLFLANLSACDLCYSTVITPKLLYDMFLKRKSITFIGCTFQLYFFTLLGSIEEFSTMLSTMAYDRYVAICHPLLYVVIMNRTKCILLLIAVYAGGILTAGIHTSSAITLSFCGSNIINHFYCDIPPLMDLSCSDTYINKTIIFALTLVLGFVSVVVIIASYIYIFITIIQIQSAEGRHKAFSTCTSHISCVALFYGTAFFMYLRPSSGYSGTQNKIVSIFYTVIIPMLNPFIYSLRNSEVKGAVNFATS